MKTIIAGSRSVKLYDAVDCAIRRSEFDITEVVSGGANGPDKFGIEWATIHKVPYKVFNADWETYDRAAGPIRNEEMAKYADALIAVWDGKSKGTRNMLSLADKYGLITYLYKVDIL